MSSACKLCRIAALAFAAVLPAASSISISTRGAVSSARADTLDLSLPRTVMTGAPRGAAPSERLDPLRTGRARTALPATPVELWRRQVSGNIDVPPVIDAADDILVVLNNPEIIKLGPDARELWSARLNNASAQAPPTLLSDGTVAVVTTAGIAWGFTPSGNMRFSTALGIPRRDADTAPLALADGGLLVAAGNVVVEIDADGAVRARATLEDRAAGGLGAVAPVVPFERATGAVLAGPGDEGGALITTTAGNVYRFRPPALPHKIGSFGGTTPRGAAVADERTLVAVVDGRRLVALDLPTGTLHVRTGGLAFDGPPTVGPGGLVLLGTQLGMLLGVDAAGNERAHILLDKPSSVSSGASSNVFVQVDLKPSPPLVVDASGRVAFVRGNGRMGVVSPTGRVEVAAEGLCAVPIAVLPAGDRRLMVACHDGRLWMYGE